MRTVGIFLFTITLFTGFLVFPTNSHAIIALLKPVPPPDSLAADVARKSLAAKHHSKKVWRAVAAIPAIKVTESTRENALLDASVLTSVGGGISWQKLSWDSSKDVAGGWTSTFSFSPATLLLSGDFSEGGTDLDLAYAATVGFWDNLIMAGIGVDLGEVSERSRVFGLLSFGINFNN